MGDGVLVGDSGTGLGAVTGGSDTGGLNGFQGAELGDGVLVGESGSGLVGAAVVVVVSGAVGQNGLRNMELGD